MAFPADRPVPRWLHVLAIYTVLHTALLLILGGFVTSFRVGMADPVWPTEPWYLAGNFKVDFGYLVEHFHRIVGWTLGVPGLVLTFGLWAYEPRFGLRWFGLGGLVALLVTFSTVHGVLRLAPVGQEGWLVYLNLVLMGLTLAVVVAAAHLSARDGGVGGTIRAVVVAGMIAAMVQGLLGGVRVRYNELAGRELSAVHGVAAQIVFALLIAVAVLTRKPRRGPVLPEASAAALEWQSLALVLFTFSQIVWGVWIRHFPGPLANRVHLFFAFVVVGFATLVIKQVASEPAARDRLRLPVRCLMGLITLQVVLGIEAWIGKFLTGTLPEFETITAGKALVRTAHAHVGAWVLGVAVILALLARRNPTGDVGPQEARSLNSEETPVSEPVLVGRRPGPRSLFMKVAVSPTVPAVPALSQRLADYVELTKPRIAVMVLVTVAAGYLMATGTDARLVPLLHTLIGTAMVAGGASAWNMWVERGTDARMRRTADRPLPAGRLHHLEVVVFGTALAVTGINYLYHALPSPAAALVALLSFVTYVAVYTPLKQLTVFNTHIGAVPGALPPVIGWCAATGSVGWDAVALFLVLLFWQLPHFMAIAWMYRHDYARAGHRMLPVEDPTGRKTSRAMIGWCAVLIAASLLPLVYGAMDWLYLAGALALGAYFLRSTLRFRTDRTEGQARQVLKASILYLPAMMALFLVHSVGCTPSVSPPTSSPKPDLSLPVPDFTLTERSGRRVARDDLKGKVWVAAFVFTRCSGACPQVTATMARLQKELDLAGNDDVRLVTFTVDPDKDTPNELKEYAVRYQADPERWLFLTGVPEAELHKLLHDGFKVTAQRAANPKAGDEFDHSSRLAVVDRRGNIRGYFDGLRAGSSPESDADFNDNLNQLRAKVAELRRE